MRVLQIVGARPQFIKLAPVSQSLARAASGRAPVEELVLHTGQHYDDSMSAVFFEQLALPRPVGNLGVGSGAHGAQTAKMLEGIEEQLLRLRPDVVVIYGDTNSTVAGALAAAKLGIRLVHVEAGLRSFNRRMPEELNRVVADHLSNTLLAPTQTAMQNLQREGLAEKSVLVGDVMCDAVLWGKARASSTTGILGELGLSPEGFALTKIHRAENTSPEALGVIVNTLTQVAQHTVPLVWPMHPRTRSLLSEAMVTTLRNARVTTVDPLSYLEMLALLDRSAFVLTDSGGLQKEAFVLGVPCVTMRSETEWTESVLAGANVVAGIEARNVVPAAVAQRQQRHRADEFSRRAVELYGGGHAADRVAGAILAA